MRPAQRRPQSRNRRVSNVRQRRQQHLLDVKVRSRRAAQHRARRVLAVLSRVILLAIMLIRSLSLSGNCLGGWF